MVRYLHNFVSINLKKTLEKYANETSQFNRILCFLLSSKILSFLIIIKKKKLSPEVNLLPVYISQFTPCFTTPIYMGCSLKFLLKVAVEESIVNEPLVSLHSKTQTTQKVRLDLHS
jgi:hypothetical protein